MENVLKVGQRVELFNVKGTEIYGFDITGKTVVAERLEDIGQYAVLAHFCAFHGYETKPVEYVECALMEDEIKPVGCFIVREVKTNTDPCTII